MNKYYYDCPLEAAYMAKNFGVKYHDWVWNDYEFVFDAVIAHNDEYLGKLYIHPDSMKIFEPVADDQNIVGYVYYDAMEIDGHHFEKGWYYNASLVGDSDTRVDRRNGKSFIWYEEEK